MSVDSVQPGASSSLVLRLLRRARGDARHRYAKMRTLSARTAFEMRLRAVAAGLARPEVAIVECARGDDESGLFSEVAAVIGFLEVYEQRRHWLAGVHVRFGDGLYHDASVGPNWWDYYFEPIDKGSHGAPPRVIDLYHHDWCANRVERTMPREIAAGIVERHVRPTEAVAGAVDTFVRERWPGGRVVGVHYRGTDKHADAVRMSYEDVAEAVTTARRAIGDDNAHIFVATDEQAFVEFMTARFGTHVSYREMFRSTDGRPIDVVNADGNYQKGLDAVIDCLLLARTHTLVRTASNLSLCATFFNKTMPVRLLNPER
jgi:hypothetical protein